MEEAAVANHVGVFLLGVLLLQGKLGLCQSDVPPTTMPESIDLKVTEEMQAVNMKHCNYPPSSQIKVWLSSSRMSNNMASEVLPCTPDQQLISPPSFYNDTRFEKLESCPWKWTCTYQETRHPQTIWKAVSLADTCLNGMGTCLPNTIRHIVLHWHGCNKETQEPEWTYNLAEVAVGVTCQEELVDHYAL